MEPLGKADTDEDQRVLQQDLDAIVGTGTNVQKDLSMMKQESFADLMKARKRQNQLSQQFQRDSGSQAVLRN